MATRISNDARNGAVEGVTALLDDGYIEIRSGSQPAGPSTAATGDLLGTLELSDPAFGAASSGSATANAIASDTEADASGIAGWFRAYSSDGDGVIDGSITTTAAGTGDMLMDDVNIVMGGTITISSWTITMPAA